MRSTLGKLFAVVAALALVATACGDGDGGDQGTGESFTVTIGGVLPLTGALSDFGPAMSRGMELAVEVFEEAAAEAGQDITVEVAGIEDSQTDAAAGVEAARKLVDTGGANAIVGGAASSVTIAVAESVTIPSGVAQCSPASTSGDITTLEDDGLVFRTPPSDEHQAPILADLVKASLGDDATVSLGARNDAYGTFLIEGVEEELKAVGLSTTGPVLWNPDAATFDSEASKIVSGDPDGFVLIDFPGTWQKMGPALVRTGGWDPATTFSADGLKTSKLPEAPPAGAGPETTEGMRGTAPGGTEAFDALWTEKVTDVGRETFDAHTFDCTMLLLLAATAAGSGDGAEIAAEMQAVSSGGTEVSFDNLADAITAIVDGEDVDYDGASGPVDMDDNGDPQSVGAVYEIYRFEDGKMVIADQERVEEAAA